MLFGHQIIPNHLLNYKALGTKLFHRTLLIQNGPPKGPPDLYRSCSKGTSNQKIYLGNKLFHGAFIFKIQNGTPKGPPAL